MATEHKRIVLLLACMISLHFIIMPATFKKPKVLLFNAWGWHLPGGGSNHFLYLHKIIQKQRNIDSELLSYKDSFIAHEAVHLGLSCQTYTHKMTEDYLLRFCEKHHIDIVTFPTWNHAELFKKVAKKKRLKLVYVRQGSIDDDLKNNIRSLKGLDAIVSINQAVTDYFIWANKQYHLGVKIIKTIAPSWDQDRVDLIFNSPIQQRKDFFQKRFNIQVEDNVPLICTVANMEDPVKNQILLIKALEIIIKKQNQPLYAFFVGEGKLRKFYENEIAQRGLQKYVHCLGPMLDAPALLYYADMHVLPSYAEGFPVINIEASYMGKPIMAAHDTGSVYLIDDNKTGYLFKNNDEIDLAHKLIAVFQDPSLLEKLSENARTFVNDNFLNETLLKKWELLVKEITK